MRALFFVVAIFSGHLTFAEQPATKELPKPLPDTVTKAWTEAGATVGWMKYDNETGLVFVDKPEAGAVPAFKFTKWKEGMLAKLPVPQEPFGLYLAKTELTDTGLKELANFKNLVSLCICETEVTFDAADEFRKLLPKCFVFHC